MAESKSKSAGGPPPGIYSAAAQMALQGGGKAGSPSPTPGAGANQGEKLKNVQTLLEVFKKMDQIEDDPESKTMIQQMSDMAQKYSDKLQGKAGDGKPAASAASADAGGTPPAAPGAGAGGGPEGVPVPA